MRGSCQRFINYFKGALIMEYDDLRDFLSLLENKQELIHIKEPVDWDIEIGAISQESINLGEKPLSVRTSRTIPILSVGNSP